MEDTSTVKIFKDLLIHNNLIESNQEIFLFGGDIELKITHNIIICHGSNLITLSTKFGSVDLTGLSLNRNRISGNFGNLINGDCAI